MAAHRGGIGELLREPFSIDGASSSITASIGIALSDAGDKREELLRNADIAMYDAKARGGTAARSSTPACTAASSSG